MENVMKQAYQEGRKVASLEPQRQQERRANVLERAEVFSGENMEKLKIHGSLQTEERKQVVSGFERLLMGRPIEAHRQNLRMGYLYLALFFIILAAEFWLLQWTFRPFNLGAESFVISLGLMIVGTTALEEYLRMLQSRNPVIYNKWRLWFVFFSAIFFIVALLLLSNARAALISANTSAESLEAQVNTANQFYARTSFVYVAIALGSLAIAFVSGILLHEAISRLFVSGPVISHANKLREMEHSIGQIAANIKELEVLPRKTVNEFDRGVLDGPLSNENPLLSPIAMIIISIILILAIVAFARGEERVGQSMIVLLDLTGSSQGTDYANKTEFQKNIEAVKDIIKKAEPGTHLRIVGITDQSFDKPFVIFDRTLSKEKGYFSEKMAKEKLSIFRTWEQIKLEPKSKTTDVFGALVLSSMLFEKESMQKKLIILSDLRNSSLIDLESMQSIPENILQKIERKEMIADLKTVKVWALGVSTTNKSFQYWSSLKAFWQRYFEKSGAALVSFSVERNWELL